MNIGASWGEQYRLAEAERHIAEGIAYTTERDLDYANHYMHAWLALVRLYQGRWSEAAEIATGLLARPNLSVISRIMALVALGRVRARRGDADADAGARRGARAGDADGHAAAAGAGAGRARRSRVAGGRPAARRGGGGGGLSDLATQHCHRWFTGELVLWRRLGGEAIAAPTWAGAAVPVAARGDWRRAARPNGRISAASTSRRARWPTAIRAAQIAALEIFMRLGAAPAAAAAAPAHARRRHAPDPARAAGGTRRTRSASPPASCRSWTACRSVSPTAASAPSCMSRPRRSTITCRRCCPSSAPPRAARPRASPSPSIWSRDQEPQRNRSRKIGRVNPKIGEHPPMRAGPRA